MLSVLYGLSCMQKSKSVAKRQREEEAEAKADKQAKKMRLQMKTRGHMVSICIYSVTLCFSACMTDHTAH